MSVEQRWPLFATRAAEAGARGMLSIQLWVEGDDLGALNLYSRTANAFTDESENIGLLVAYELVTSGELPIETTR